MDKIFEDDKMSKRERVEATLSHLPVDRCALLEQLSYNPRVIAEQNGRKIDGFDYTLDEICSAIRKTMDIAMPPCAPLGTSRFTTHDGFVYQNDNWTRWLVSRPFHDEHGACEWLKKRTDAIIAAPLDPLKERKAYRARMRSLQEKLGDTVILDYAYSTTGLCGVYGDGGMGLEIFAFFQMEYPEALKGFLDAHASRAERVANAIADPALSPVILVAEDFATKQGPIFSPDFLKEFHYPYLRRLAAAWHERGMKVLYHSDGNWRRCIPDLIACGFDGFYCLERNCGMDIVEFKSKWPEMVWAGGVDGVDLMEYGTPEQVKAEVKRQIMETNALRTGGMFVASSSEINPPIPPENFRAMVEAVGECAA